MLESLDPGLACVFGSSTRLGVLATLANSNLPLTAYRVARTLDVNPPKVYTELARLMEAKVVRVSSTENGSRGFSLADPDVAELLRKRVRISSEASWMAEIDSRSRSNPEATEIVRALSLEDFPANPENVPNRSEFFRPRSKDRTLSRMGLRMSRRTSR
ncbi:MAG: hypothetical protein KGJ23_10060 [Euryarchaeota archaeon]|nr:hypothetical protein [Euryarchaeota archaeon]MDE1836948.1 hypothetical protein [Euryarchaeota archaeon]MDE1882062.1 hypothetical protein [Euryarchaeota archaeon]MDE2045867.1 hypothetical protein [Thermoplasmata archaeon]